MKAFDYRANVYQNGAAMFMARIRNFAGELIEPSMVSSVSYSVYLLSIDLRNERTPVTGYTNVPLMASDVLYTQLQCPDCWDQDTTGYNFACTLRPGSSDLFKIPGRHYLVEFKFVHGNIPFLLRYRVFVI